MHLRWRESVGSCGMITLRVRHQGLDTAFGRDLAKGSGVASLVCRNGAGLEAREENRRYKYVGDLAGGQGEAARSCEAVVHHLDLGDQSFA